MDSHFGELTSQGIYKGFGVVVADFHYSLCCFGKGTFSRGRPLYYTPPKPSGSVEQLVIKASRFQILSDKWITRRRRREFLYSDTVRIAPFAREILLRECKVNTINILNVMETDLCTCSPIIHASYATFLNTSECNIEDNSVDYLTGCILRHRNYSQRIFELKEYLHLFHEEAFYLAYMEKTICLMDENFTKIALSLIWYKYNDVNSKFRFFYAAYVYFKSKGWLPKCGSKYGVDLVLYKLNPDYSHSDYGVLLFLYGIGNRNFQSLFETFQWLDYTKFNRNLESVVKETLICCVNRNLKDCRYSLDEYEDILNIFEFSQYKIRKWDTDL